MKFGKEFVSQMVPEWHEAYMNYGHLKTLLKDIQRFKHKTSRAHSTRQAQPGQKRKLGLYRAFSGLTQRHHEALANQTTTFDIENPVIFVDTVNRNGSERYQTKFLKTGDEGGEYELVFFRRLDDELNKVLKFYLTKVDEVIEEASALEKQMHALIAFRIKVEKPHGWLDFSGEMSRAASEDEVSTAALSASGPSWANSSRRVLDDEASATELSASAPSWAKSSKRVSVEIIDEETKSQEQTSASSDESSDDNYVANEDTKPINKKMQEYKNYKKQQPNDYVQDKRAQPPSPLEVLDRVKLNVSLETPLSTIKVLLNVPMQTDLKFNKENLKKAEEQLKKVFVVFYHKLRILKSYNFMNILAFSKIMKKYDKIASRSASKSYMKMIDKSFLGSSNEVNKLMDRVEATFIKHFSNSNRSKGMDLLRPKARRERHRITFSFGFFAGCTVALVVALILIIRARHILDKKGGSQYMNTMFPLYSLFAFVVLHMLMYAGDIYFWRKYRVNYSFIFGFKQGTELGYRDVLYLGFSIAVLALVSVLSNLDMEMDPKTNDYKTYTELIPLMVLWIIVAILICPFNILHRSSRFFLLKSAFRCLSTPLYSVTFTDCILADQLTSQVQAFRSLEFYICYYGWGDFRHRQNTCKTTDSYNTFSFIVAAIPYTIRLLQCLRRLFEVKDTLQAYNALKYFATIVAVCTRTAYSLEKGMTWKIVAWICSGVAAITCTYWDLVIDWGLLQRHSKNRWLRDKLFIPHKSVYFVAMVLNVILRFAWLQTVLNFKITSLHTEALIAIFASLEIIRRGIWNFFRLENEHLSNVGKFRAHNSVPLPFNYDDDEEKDE